MDSARRWSASWNYPQVDLVVIRNESLSFCKFEIIPPLLCCLLDVLTNKYCRARNSMINLGTDSRTCEKNPVAKNYLEIPRESNLGNMMLLHWPRLTWKFFVVWFHKILQLIFQTPSCPKSICTEHGTKLPA